MVDRLLDCSFGCLLGWLFDGCSLWVVRLAVCLVVVDCRCWLVHVACIWCFGDSWLFVSRSVGGCSLSVVGCGCVICVACCSCLGTLMQLMVQGCLFVALDCTLLQVFLVWFLCGVYGLLLVDELSLCVVVWWVVVVGCVCLWLLVEVFECCLVCVVGCYLFVVGYCCWLVVVACSSSSALVDCLFVCCCLLLAVLC